jgi:membrane protease YdiL (CAAX protease family)
MESKLLTRKKKANCIFLLLLLGLLLFRFPFEILLALNKIPIPKMMGVYIYEDGTYLIIAILMILKRDSLSDYNLGFCSLIIFMISPVAELFSEYLEMKYASIGTVQSDLWFRIVISVCLLIVLLLYRPRLRKRSVKEILLWFLIAVVVGIFFGVLAGKISSLQGGGRFPYRPSVLIIISSFFIQLGNAAAMEEPLFRGFLWGFLKKLHWKDYWIWLFQAALFWLGHIYYLGVYNYSFWIIVPLGGLILGLVAWRSRSIGTSMIVHGLSNSIADIVAHFTW